MMAEESLYEFHPSFISLTAARELNSRCAMKVNSSVALVQSLLKKVFIPSR